MPGMEQVGTDDQHVTSGTEGVGPSKRGLTIAGALVALTAIVVAAAILLSLSEDGLVAGQPRGVLDEYVAALQANDAEAATALLGSDLVAGFTPFLVGTDTSSLLVSDCENAGGNRVRCTTDFGPNWFYSRIIDEEMITTFTVSIEDGEVDVIAWPAPVGLYEADAVFEEFVSGAHPDRYDEMYDANGGIKQGLESGAARTALAEDFLDASA